MKRYICLIISLCLILSSFSFVFATATSWDTSDQANLLGILRAVTSYGTSNLFYKVSHLDTTLTSISSDISTIKGYLYDSGHSIGYYISGISSWMSPIYNAITSIPTDLFTITGALGYYDSNNTYHPYLASMNKPLMRIKPADWVASDRYDNANYNLVSSDGSYNFTTVNSDGNLTTLSYIWTNGTPLGNIALFLQRINQANANMFSFNKSAGLSGYNSTQNVINWGSLSTSTFTPSSATDGVYKYLASIQAPVARLSYVLASDERIAAQEAAALAEQEVVDNFIDPAGDSSATASDFGSISDLSSGYQQNFGSTASVSGIFDIFDSDNFGWFSSETYQQLDTTVAQRGSSFETPLLDQQLEDISRALGVDYAN